LKGEGLSKMFEKLKNQTFFERRSKTMKAIPLDMKKLSLCCFFFMHPLNVETRSYKLVSHLP